jgi:hypothetical protein
MMAQSWGLGFVRSATVDDGKRCTDQSYRGHRSGGLRCRTMCWMFSRPG